MRSLPVIRRALLSAAVLVSMASSAYAIVNPPYNPAPGPNVMFLGVQEEVNQTPPPVPATLFGTGTMVGDDLTFNPLNFGDFVENGAFLIQDGKLSVQNVMTNSPLGAITSLAISESGGWIVRGPANASTARVTLIAPPSINVLLSNGSSIDVTPTVAFANPVFGTATPTATSANGTTSLNFASAGGIGNGSWSIKASYDIAGKIASLGLPASVRAVKVGSFGLDNQIIQTTTGPDTLSYIDKKMFNIEVTAVPEPSTILLGLMGGVGLVLGGRRLKKVKTA